MGYDKDMTLEFIEVCAMWARAFGLVAGDIEEEEVLEAGEAGVKAFSIRFASGFRITALPSVPARCAVSRASSSLTKRRSTKTLTK